MKQFVLIFRMDLITESAQPTQEQMEVYMQDWTRWIDGIAASGQFAEGGNHLSKSGRLLRTGNKTSQGPYAVNNESVAGYIIILAKDPDDAVKIAGKCPILQGEGTSVEVREASAP